MIGCLRTRVRKQPISAPYFESENELKFYNLEARISQNKTHLTCFKDLTHISGYTRQALRQFLTKLFQLEPVTIVIYISK